MNKKFSSLWNCTIISTYTKKLIFTKKKQLPLYRFQDWCENQLGWSPVCLKRKSLAKGRDDALDDEKVLFSLQGQ